MSTVEVTLPDELKARMDEQVASGRFNDRSEYVRALIEADRRRDEQGELERQLTARMDGPDLVEMDSGDIGRMREEFVRRQGTPNREAR